MKEQTARTTGRSLRVGLACCILLVVAVNLLITSLFTEILSRRLYQRDMKRVMYSIYLDLTAQKDLSEASAASALAGYQGADISLYVFDLEESRLVYQKGGAPAGPDPGRLAVLRTGLSPDTYVSVEPGSWLGREVNRLTGGAEAISTLGTIGARYLLVLQINRQYVGSTIAYMNRLYLMSSVITLIASAVLILLWGDEINRSLAKVVGLTREATRDGFDPDTWPHPTGYREIQELSVNVGGMARSLIGARNDLAARSKSQMLYLSNASHELKSPIHIIQGYAESLASGVMEADEAIPVIMDECTKMAGLINDLMILSKIELPQAELRRQPYDLAGLVRDTVQRLAAGQTDAGIELAGADRALRVSSVRSLDEQVIRNYLENALKYRPSGTPVQVCLVRSDSAASLTVINAGSLSQEDRNHIWEPFYRADMAHGRSEGSYGLGLAIVRSIAQRLGHQCRVEPAVLDNGPALAFIYENLPLEQPDKAPGTLAQLGGAL